MGSASRRSNGGASSSSSSASSPTRPTRDNRPLLPRTPSALLFPPAPPPLHITIRFSTSLPDLHLDIPSPQQTTVVALKHLIRGRLAADAAAKDKSSPAHPSRARLRFIHNGRILPDTAVLGAVLKAPPPPPLADRPPPDPKGKGKARSDYPQPQQRVFINCSIGDALSEAELSAEAAAAEWTPPPAPSSPFSPSSTTSASASASASAPASRTSATPLPPPPLSIPPPHLPTTTTTTRPAPLGFDRLQQAGFTPAEIALLRRQFRAIHAARFTPDTMPSPDTLRAMEDAWLDNGSSSSGNPLSTLGEGGGGGGEEALGDGGIEGGMAANDDVNGIAAIAGPLTRGMLLGFLFPLGVIAWAGREEGMWSQRMRVFIVAGVLASLTMGLARELAGDG